MTLKKKIISTINVQMKSTHEKKTKKKKRIKLQDEVFRGKYIC